MNILVWAHAWESLVALRLTLSPAATWGARPQARHLWMRTVVLRPRIVHQREPSMTRKHWARIRAVQGSSSAEQRVVTSLPSARCNERLNTCVYRQTIGVQGTCYDPPTSTRMHARRVYAMTAKVACIGACRHRAMHELQLQLTPC